MSLSPSIAFGWFLRTANKPDPESFRDIPVIDRPFKLFNGWGTNVAATESEVVSLLVTFLADQNPVLQTELLKNSLGEQQMYNLKSRGMNNVPLRIN